MTMIRIFMTMIIHFKSSAPPLSLSSLTRKDTSNHTRNTVMRVFPKNIKNDWYIPMWLMFLSVNHAQKMSKNMAPNQKWLLPKSHTQHTASVGNWIYMCHCSQTWYMDSGHPPWYFFHSQCNSLRTWWYHHSPIWLDHLISDCNWTNKTPLDLHSYRLNSNQITMQSMVLSHNNLIENPRSYPMILSLNHQISFSPLVI